MNYHYVYRITNKIQNKHYYGVRSSKIEPKLDLGIKYFSSSSNKEFILDQKENFLTYKYKIIKKFNSKEEAIKLEIKLHKKFNVGINESFYNKSIQTSTGYDRTGISHSVEAKKKLSELNKGKIHSVETKQKISESQKGKNGFWFNKTLSEEHKTKISSLGRHCSDETKQKISESNKNNNYICSDEAKAKMSKANKGILQKIVICPYCCKEGGISAMKRWHFDNCELKHMDPENCSIQD